MARDFKASGLAARGWVWLAYDHDWNTLTTVVGDAQNTFPLWNATPILALDVYEHAYWIDYGRARAKYIEAFFNNLDWTVVEQNLEQRARHAGGPQVESRPGRSSVPLGRAPAGARRRFWRGCMATSLLPVIGKPAPDFSLPSTTGENISLKQFKGKKTVILYFYPKDETPGCTRRRAIFATTPPSSSRHNAVILGVSTDSLESHQHFREKHKLPFPLLSDEDAAVSKLFGVYKTEEPVRQEVHGHRAHHVRHRQDRHGSRRSIPR